MACEKTTRFPTSTLHSIKNDQHRTILKPNNSGFGEYERIVIVARTPTDLRAGVKKGRA